MQRTHELDRATQCDAGGRVGEVEADRVDQVPDIYLNLDKDVENVGCHAIDGYQARVSIVHEQVAPSADALRSSTQHAPYGDITHDDALGFCECFEYVGDDAGVQQETLGHL